VIHTMPDKTVRVTARFPKGQSIVYFDLGQARGFTLDKRLQGGSHNGGFFSDARIFLRFCEQFVLDRDRSSHGITLQCVKYSSI